MKNTTAEYKRLDNQLLSLMTHVHNFLKGRLTLGELGEAEERAEVFRTNQVTNYDEVAERVNTAQIKQENAELRKKHEDALKLMGLVMTQPTDISVALANAEKEKWVQCDQLEELRKDKERLDWILEHCDVGYDNFYKTSFENRDEIDQAMEGTTNQ